MADDTNLTTEVGKFSYGFFKAFLEEQKDKIENFFSKNKVGFLPEGCNYDNKKRTYPQPKGWGIISCVFWN